MQKNYEIVHQVIHNLKVVPKDQFQNQDNSVMISVREQIQKFDLSFYIKETSSRVNKLEKSKNMLIKELQSLKAYSMDKIDRATIKQSGATESIEVKN